MTGEGERLDVALMDTMHHAMSFEYVDAQFPGQAPPVFRPMRTRDGFLAIAPVSEPNFRALVRAAARSEWLEDARFARREQRMMHWEAMLDTIEGWTATLTSAEAEAALLREGCPASAYRTIAEARLDPQVAARGASVEVTDGSGAFQVANCPIQFAAHRARASTAVADIGEHTEAMLGELGYSADQIRTLRGEGALAS